MKKLLIIFALLLSYTATSQISLEAGTDPKILIFGTDNQYTIHDGVANVNVKASYIDDVNNYIGVEVNWTDLQDSFVSISPFFGRNYTNIFNIERLSILPNFQIGLIWRDYLKYPKVAAGVNLPVRFKLSDNWSLQGTGQIQDAKDLPKRTLRYSVFAHVVYTF